MRMCDCGSITELPVAMKMHNSPRTMLKEHCVTVGGLDSKLSEDSCAGYSD